MKNKALRIGLDIALILIGIVFLIFGIKDAIETFKNNQIEDNVKFKRTYSEITEDNIYRYTDLKKANKLIDEGTGVLLIGQKNDSWMHVLVSPLNEFVKDYQDIIYYLEIDNDDTNDKNYQTLTQKLEKIKTPTIVLIKDGNILSTYNKNDIFDSTFEGAPIEYFTEERTTSLKEKIKISDLK